MNSNRMNILLVMTDQQRVDLRRGEGYSLDTMPFLDQFAAEGVDFGRAYTANPVCMAARVSLFTGRYPSAHQVRTNHNQRDALYTRDLLDVLKEAGYRTALCGKNHSHRNPEDFDFHETCGHLGYEGEINETASEREFADFLCATNHMETCVPSPGGVEVQHPYRNVSSALRFIDSCPAGEPWFAWVSFAEPHNPYQVPAPYFDLFPPESLPPVHAGAECLEEKGPRWTWLRHTWERILGPDIESRILRARSNYHGMLRLIDDQFRRLVEGLEVRGLRDHTLIVYLSDHGDFVGEYGLIRKGADRPEMLTRIPLMMQGPGIPKAGRCENTCVNIIDLFPTICAMLGVPIPFGVQGRNLLPLLRGENVPPHEFDVAYAESGFGGLWWTDSDGLTLPAEGACDEAYTRFDCLNTWTQCGQVRMVRKGDWKIQCDMLGETNLYNLKDDPYELQNLAHHEKYAAIKAEMLGELAAAMMRAADPLPPPHHRYRVKRHPSGFWQDADYTVEDPGITEI